MQASSGELHEVEIDKSAPASASSELSDSVSLHKLKVKMFQVRDNVVQNSGLLDGGEPLVMALLMQAHDILKRVESSRFDKVASLGAIDFAEKTFDLAVESRHYQAEGLPDCFVEIPKRITRLRSPL